MRRIILGAACLTALWGFSTVNVQAINPAQISNSLKLVKLNSTHRRFPLSALEKVGISVGRHQFNVYVLDTPAKQAEGWSYLRSHDLSNNEGMLFVYRDDSYRSLTVANNCPISLDIAFLPSNKAVRSVQHLDAHGYHRNSTGTGQYVLTLKRGTFNSYGIKTGTQIIIPRRLKTAFHEDAPSHTHTYSYSNSSACTSCPSHKGRIHPLHSLKRVGVTVGGKTYHVRVLDTLAKRSEGANNLKEYDMGCDDGLLLAYPSETSEGFMKPASGGNPLPDLVFIGSNNQVTGTYTLHDRTNQTATQVNAKVKYVLMLKRNMIRNNSITSGRYVSVPYIYATN